MLPSYDSNSVLIGTLTGPRAGQLQPRLRDADPDYQGWLCQRCSSKVQQRGHSLAMRKVPLCFSRVLNARWRQPRPWFGTKRPQVQILSPRPVPQISDLRECRTLRAVFHFPAIATEASREQKGTRGNPRESRGRLRRAEEHPASPHDVADPAAQQGPSGHCDPPSATKRPFGREVRRPEITADPKSASS